MPLPWLPCPCSQRPAGSRARSASGTWGPSPHWQPCWEDQSTPGWDKALNDVHLLNQYYINFEPSQEEGFHDLLSMGYSVFFIT